MRRQPTTTTIYEKVKYFHEVLKLLEKINFNELEREIKQAYKEKKDFSEVLPTNIKELRDLKIELKQLHDNIQNALNILDALTSKTARKIILQMMEKFEKDTNNTVSISLEIIEDLTSIIVQQHGKHTQRQILLSKSFLTSRHIPIVHPSATVKMKFDIVPNYVVARIFKHSLAELIDHTIYAPTELYNIPDSRSGIKYANIRLLGSILESFVYSMSMGW